MILNGIEEFARRSDLIDRCVFLDLPPIASNRRRCEDKFWDAFHQDYPRILGALLDAVVGGLRELPSVQLSELPRMADFTKFAEAVGRSLGWPAETALLDYSDNRVEAAIAQLEDSPVAAVLLGPDMTDDWSGTPSDLLFELTAFAGRKAQSPRWPKSPACLTVELRRIAPQLGMHGKLVNVSRHHNGRVVSITRIPTVAQEKLHTRDPMADEECGSELETQEKRRHGQIWSQV